MMRYILILFALTMFAGCTSRGWYDGMQQSASKDCAKYEYQSPEYEKCIESTNISYDRYRQEISNNKKKQ